MAGNNDILASAGIDLSAFEQGIAKLTSRLDAIEKAGSKAASGIQKVEESASALKNIKIADHLVNALDTIAGTGGQASGAISDLSNSMMIASNSFDDAGGASVEMNAAIGRTIDFASAMPGPIAVSYTHLRAHET